MIVLTAAKAQTVEQLIALCDSEQQRLDNLDGKADTAILFNTEAQKRRGTAVYFHTVDRIQTNLALQKFPEAERKDFYSNLVQVLQGLNKSNVRYLAYFEQYFYMVEQLSAASGDQKDRELLKNHVSMALDCIPYFVKRSYAQDVLLFCSTKKPYDVLTKYGAYARESWFLSILESVAKNDPNAIKQYFGAQHTVNFALKTSKDPVVLTLYDIFSEYGRTSSAYTNIDLVYNKQLTIEASENLVGRPAEWFKTLCVLRTKPGILGSYSVDQEMANYSLNVMRKVNLLHDDPDNVRFASIQNLSAMEMYNLMVYSKDEIFTSSFLGTFKRMMSKRQDSSLFVFFEKQGFNKFRTFVQMCAGYNTLQMVINTMNSYEKELFLDEIVKDLEKTGGNLEPAVEVADIFGSITDEGLKNKMADKLGRELMRCFGDMNLYGARLYGLLYKLAGRNPQEITGNTINFDIPLLDKVSKELMFPDGKNIQQHIFFDDEDGEAAYAGFIAHFRADKNYKITDLGSFVKLESVSGNKIVIYCNKPDREEALDDLRRMFEKNNRYPDIVVHRGHSYHLGSTIDVLTNNTKVAVLGSCGGYLNITRVLDNAAEAQIVSSKQVGTWTVNNVLLKDMTDMMRVGTGEIDWKVLWLNLDKKLNTNEKWKDYIPPYQNLGVRFVKAFETI